MSTYEVEWLGPKMGEGRWAEIESGFIGGERRRILCLLNGQTAEQVANGKRICDEGGRLLADSTGVYMEKSFQLIRDIVKDHLSGKGDKRHVESGIGVF